MTYTYKVAKDGLVRHSPCFFTKMMGTCSEEIQEISRIMRELHEASKTAKRKKDISQLAQAKELYRAMLNDTKKTYNYAEKKYETECVGSRECYFDKL